MSSRSRRRQVARAASRAVFEGLEKRLLFAWWKVEVPESEILYPSDAEDMSAKGEATVLAPVVEADTWEEALEKAVYAWYASPTERIFEDGSPDLAFFRPDEAGAIAGNTLSYIASDVLAADAKVLACDLDSDLGSGNFNDLYFLVFVEEIEPTAPLEDCGCNGEDPFSDAPINYSTGGLEYVADDLLSGGFGFPFGSSRSFTNAKNNLGNVSGGGIDAPYVLTPNGLGWVSSQMPTLTILDSASGPDAAVITAGAHNTLWFDLEEGDYVPKFYLKDQLIEDGGVYTWINERGEETTFDSEGFFTGFTDAAGNVTTVSYDVYRLPTTMTRQSGSGAQQVTETFTYNLVGSGDMTGAIGSITLDRSVGGAKPEVVRKAVYTYGEEQELKLVVIEDANQDPISTHYYRYYEEDDAHIYTQAEGYPHALKYVVHDESYDRLIAEHGTADAASDEEVAVYANLYFEYDSRGRVVKEVAQGLGCSSCSGGLGTYTFEYTPSIHDDHPNKWHMKTVETQPDGSTNTVFTNAYGQVMLKALSDGVNTWADFYLYDADGRVIWHAHPSAITGTVDDWDDHDDLMNLDGDYEHLSDSSGLIEVFVYGSSTTADDDTIGNVEGYQQARKVRRGELGSDITQQAWQYIQSPYTGSDVFVVATDTVYRNTNETGGQTTSYTYTWHPSTAQIATRTVTYAAVTAGQNGPDAATRETTAYDLFGRMVWSRDQDGFITFYEYDTGTGAVIAAIWDADTANFRTAGATYEIDTLTSSGTTATVTTTSAHNLTDGDWVRIVGAESLDGEYNGVFQVDVTSSTVFTYVMASDPADDSADPAGDPMEVVALSTALVSMAVTLTASSTTATATTSSAHGYVAGDWIRVTGASPGAYNGLFQVATVPSATTFTYTTLTGPGSSGSGTVTWGTPASGGQNLVTQSEVDHMGRTTKYVDANGNITYTVYNDPAHEVRVYRGWTAANKTTGPIEIIREYRPAASAAADKRAVFTEMLTSSAMPTVSNNRPTGAEVLNEWNVLSLSRSVTNAAGQVVQNIEFFSLVGIDFDNSQMVADVYPIADLDGIASNDSSTGNYHVTLMDYDTRGRLKRVVSPSGTITRYVYDTRGLLLETWVGTDDTPDTGFWPDETAGTNLVLVSENEYDNGSDGGDGNLTESAQYPGGGADPRVAKYFYDWRNRLVAIKAADEGGGEAGGDQTHPITYLSLDNLGQVTARTQYDGDTVSITTTDGVPVAPSSSLRRARTETGYDELGRVFQTKVFSVDPSSGDVSSDFLATNYWYDLRGNVVKVSEPGGLVTKTTYDSLGRAVKMFQSDGGGDSVYADAFDVNEDIVLSQTNYVLDNNGNVLLASTGERFHDAVTTGDLIGGDDVIPASAVIDDTTEGTWVSNYGDQGHHMANYVNLLPSYVNWTPSGSVSSYTWASSTSDTRALQKYNNPSDRIAATWYTGSSFEVELEFTDGKAHELAIYCVDWDDLDRVQTIDLIDTATGEVLDSRQLSNFIGGEWIVWNVSGTVTVRVTKDSGVNAVVSGMFFDSTARISHMRSYYDKADRLTESLDVGTYNGDPYTVATDASVPSRSDTKLVTSYEYASDEIQVIRLTDTPSGGNFTLEIDGEETDPISYNASAGTVEAELEELLVTVLGITGADVTVEGDYQNGWVVKFMGSLTMHDVPELIPHSSITGSGSPEALVDTYIDGNSGRFSRVTDPREIVTLSNSDMAGRVIQTVEAYDHTDPLVQDAKSRITRNTYTGNGSILTMTAVLPAGTFQTTQYIYGYERSVESPGITWDGGIVTVTVSDHGFKVGQRITIRGSSVAMQNGTFSINAVTEDSFSMVNVFGLGTSTVGTVRPADDVVSNDLLSAVRYPDKSSGEPTFTEQETFAHNALGQRKQYVDRNGNAHTYAQDVLGRVTSDSVLALGAGVDAFVRRLDYTYNTQGLLEKVTSNSSQFGVGTVRNEIQREYNGLGQLITEYQSHSGPVNTTVTPKVQYTFSEMDGGANHSRPTQVIYPNGRIVRWEYGASGNVVSDGVNDSISRLTFLADDSTGSIGTHLEEYEYIGLDNVIAQIHPQPGVDLTYIDNSDTTYGDGGDQYEGLDRFGRVIDHRWTNYKEDLDRFTYTYDRNSNVLSKDNELYSTNDEDYGYDNLNRLISFDRNTYDQDWTLDALGNSTSVNLDGTSQSRGVNAQNQYTSIQSLTSPAYDGNGNMTTDQNNKTLVYDAWDRVVASKTGGATNISYAYDGLHGRVSSTVSATTTDYYLSDDWQVLEEHVSGTPRVHYVWSVMYLDQMVLRDRDSDSNGSLEERIYPTHDANYNVTGLVDDEGAVLQRFMYDPYGKKTVLAANWSGTSDAYVFLHGFQGGRHDPVTNRVHFRFREHDVDLMRPASADPLGNPDGANRYQWEMSNPVGMVDPYGLFGTAGDGGGPMYIFMPDPPKKVRPEDMVVFGQAGGAGGASGGRGATCGCNPSGRCGARPAPLRRRVDNQEMTPEEIAENNRQRAAAPPREYQHESIFVSALKGAGQGLAGIADEAIGFDVFAGMGVYDADADYMRQSRMFARGGLAALSGAAGLAAAGKNMCIIGCFLPGTLVLLGDGDSKRAIEEIQVGQRVATDGGVSNSEDGKTAFADPNHTDVDPQTYRLVTIRADGEWEDGTIDTWDVQTLQPVDWLASNGIEVGGLIPLDLLVDLKEMGVPEGMSGSVVSIDQCPPIETGTGRVVLTTVSHLNNFVFNLTLKDAQGTLDTIGVTGFHKIYSEQRGWVDASDLKQGELIRTHDGFARVAGLVRDPGVHRVYNMTVESDHVYYVGDLTALVHNTNCSKRAKILGKSLRAAGQKAGRFAAHIVPGGRKGPMFSKMRGIINRVGIGTNKYPNGFRTNSPRHLGSHTKDFYRDLFGKLTKAAGNRKAVEGVLSEMCDALKNNKY